MSAEMRGNDGDRERLDALLADRAVQALPAEEARELERLLAATPGVDADEFDRAAAAVDLASSGTRFEKLPASLRQRVLQSAPEHVAKNRSTRAVQQSATSPALRSDFVRWGGWMVAAAAAAIAVVAWMPRTVNELSPEQAWQKLARTAPDEVVLPWKPTDDPDGKNVRGEVLWSKSEQKGFMKFVGLPKNDPKRVQYQLWIFDGTRDDKYPVDGGVFDVGSDGEVILPIDAHLRVEDLKMLAVTMEKPGGVVVSSRDKIVALATL